MNNSNNIFGQLSIVFGIMLIIYGIIPFFVPISCLILGSIFIFNGLRLMNVKIFSFFVSKIVSSFFKHK